jgi:uncharacterized protein YwqG
MDEQTLRLFREKLTGYPELMLYASLLESWLRPAISLLPSDEATRSRFGGIPELPPEEPWPTHLPPGGDGEPVPYRFLGQLDLAALPDVGAGLPREGLLVLFVADHPLDPDVKALFWGDPGYAMARWYPEGTPVLLREPPEEVHASGVRHLRFAAAVDLPFDEDQAPSWPFPPDTEDVYSALVSDLRTFDHLLGYPAHSTLAYDPHPGPHWIALLTVFSDDDLRWCWHDGDALMIFIEAARLRSHDFGELRSDAG